jgi:transcriptional regulator of arginine metabolism
MRLSEGLHFYAHIHMISRIIRVSGNRMAAEGTAMPSRSESWQQRRAVIEEILHSDAIHSQTDLVERLTARGFAVTQSSVSRDLQELGAVRVEGRYMAPDQFRGERPAGAGLGEIAGFVLGVAAAGPYTLVGKTAPGMASVVALALDRAGWSEIVGTVAGDDTFFIAVAGRRQQARVEAKLAALVKGAVHA